MPKETAIIHLMLFDGRRQLLPEDTDVLLRITDGNKKMRTVSQKGPVHRITVPFQNGPKDMYTVYASATGYVGAGFHPVMVNSATMSTVSLMLLPHDGTFNFALGQWNTLPADLVTFLAEGAATPADAQKRYETLVENSAPSAACLLNIVTAMRDMDFAPFSDFRQLIWDGKFAPRKDRFFAYADRRALLDKLDKAVKADTFEKEPKMDLVLHPGSTSSFKQIQFNEANVQFTFHENEDTPKGKDWVLVEPDIDFFKDAAGHSIIEVIPGFFTTTDPKGVYVLRWIAAKQARITDFNPPFVIT